MDMGKVLIDGDIIAYRAAFSSQQMRSVDTRNKVDILIESILDNTVYFPELGIDYSKTWTCYEGQERACGQCGSCNERLEAFAINDATDPLFYKD